MVNEMQSEMQDFAPGLL